MIMYRVCADVGCYSSDSAAAVEQAILDEVDALNFSISGGSNPSPMQSAWHSCPPSRMVYL